VRRSAARSPALPPLLALALAPLALGLLASLLTHPLVLDRYLIGSLPALVVLAAVGVTRWPMRRAAFVAVAALALLLSTAALRAGLAAHRPDWRATVREAQAARLQRDDCVVVYPDWNTNTWRYYARSAACLEPGSRFAAALDRPALRRLFVGVESGSLASAATDIRRARAQMTLVATRRFNRVVLYEFARRP
jgi:hypothetical protein